MLSSDRLEGDVRAITVFTFSTAWHKLWPLRPHELWGWQVLQTAVVEGATSLVSCLEGEPAWGAALLGPSLVPEGTRCCSVPSCGWGRLSWLLAGRRGGFVRQTHGLPSCRTPFVPAEESRARHVIICAAGHAC